MKKLILRIALAFALVVGTGAAVTVTAQPALADCGTVSC